MDGQTEDAKTISLRLRRGIKTTQNTDVNIQHSIFFLANYIILKRCSLLLTTTSDGPWFEKTCLLGYADHPADPRTVFSTCVFRCRKNISKAGIYNYSR